MGDLRIFAMDEHGHIENLMLLNPDKEELLRYKKQSDKQHLYLKNLKNVKKLSNDLGGYIHMRYIKNEILFNELNLDRSNISRLIYLSTFIDYNDRQENLLVTYAKNNKINYMTRKDMKEKLKISDRSFIKFLNNVKDNELLYEVDGKFYMNPEYFSKGKNKFKNKEYTRIFIDTTRLLFENCTSRQHKQLSYIYQLIPFLNYETNTICNDGNYFNPMSFKEVAQVLGVDITNRQNINKMKKELYKFNIQYENKKYYLFKGIIEESNDGKKEYFIINPYLIYGGNDYNNVKDIVGKLHFQ